MEGKVVFNFKDLLPQIEPFFALLGGDVTSEGMSSLFIAILFLIFICFLVWVFLADFLSRRSILFFRRLLQGLTPDSLIGKRQDLKQRAKQGDKRLGELWAEFDETLVVSEGEKRIQNTYDAAHFFNAHTLGRGITENRLLAAVPGFLTAIGVVGTFTGLFLGLSGLNPEEVSSIVRLIQGASIAFKTSVWGVSLSFIFNLIEKCVEQYVRYNITTLQDNIDTLFPRLSPEQTLVHVHEEARQAAITLDGLSERIGNKMQEAVGEVAQNVQTAVVEGIQQVLKPALESLAQASNDLAERQARGGAEALENLIHQFSDGLKGQGEQQQAMMEATTAEVKTAISQWGGSMTHFMDSLGALNQRMDARENARAESFDGHLQASQTVLQQSQKLYEQIETVTQGLQTSASEMRTGSELLNNASGGLRTLSEQLQAGVNQLDQTLGRVLESTQRLAKENETTGRNINQVIDVITGLKNTFSSAADRLVEASTASRDQTAQLTQHQEQLFEALKDHIDQLQQQVAQLLTDYADRVQTQTQDRLNEWTKQTQQYTSAMEAAVESIASTVEEMDGKIGIRR